MMIRALVFDFDGLILDTESVQFESWRWVYEQFGFELPQKQWSQTIGTDGGSFNPAFHLTALLGRPLNDAELHEPRRRLRDELLGQMKPMQGVRDYVDVAVQQGLRLAIASSSPRDWVVPHLECLGLLACFERIVTVDDVSRAKPAPDLYLLATRALGVEPQAALALEDSPHGVMAAKAARLWCVAVPGPMTAHLEFTNADFTLSSLSERPLGEVLRQLQARIERVISPGDVADSSSHGW